MNNHKQFAVLGLGRFGQSIVKTLAENGCSVLACDSDFDLVQEVSTYATHVVQADASDENALDAIGLGNFDVVIVAIGTNFEASVMATMKAKEMGVGYVLVKANNARQKKILEGVGADRVILPEREMGIKVATTLITTNVIDFIELSDEYGIAEIGPLHEWVGKSLQKSNIRANYGLNIVAIKRGKKIIVTPKSEEVIDQHDILVVIGEDSDIQRLSRRL